MDELRFDGGNLRFVSGGEIKLDTRITETVVGEVRMKRFKPFAFQGVDVHLKSVFFDAGAVQFLTDVPVRIDLFRMFKNHPVAGGASDLNFAPSGEIGSEVVHCLMREDEGLFHGLILLHDSAWKFILFAEQSARWGALNGVLPCGIIKIRIGKPGNFQTCVIMFPVPQSVKGDRAVMEFPGGIGFCRELTVDENVADQLRPVSPRSFVKTPDFGGMAVVPTVAEENRNSVFSRLQKPGYIIVDIGNALVILCDGRRKNPVVGLFSVDIEFVPAESAERDCGFAGI